MPSLPPAPKYQHDCSICSFLGADQTYDYYWCAGTLPTVIARYGSDGPDYAYGLEIALAVRETKPDHPLVKALNLAIEQGHYRLMSEK